MTRPAWLETVAGICGGDVEDWHEVGAHSGMWRWIDGDNGEARGADGASVWYDGRLWVEVRVNDGEADHARLANAAHAARAVAYGDLDVDALQQQVATLTRERDELAARVAALAGPRGSAADRILRALQQRGAR